MYFSRRDLFKILGITALGSQLPISALGEPPKRAQHLTAFKGISPDFQDRIVMAEGLTWKLLLKEGDDLGRGFKFGVNNDYLQFFKLTSDHHGILWVNHEYIVPLLSSSVERTAAVADLEMEMVGGSLVEIRYSADKGWEPVHGSLYNRRITAKTMIPFAGGHEIAGKKEAMGTLANCAGGRTPWNTVLTCEENYDGFYGETDRTTGKHVDSLYSRWELFHKNPPEHYGWVVEINPLTGEAKKHVTLGRFMHECATVRMARDGRPVVYSGDDANDQHLYKFISSKKGSLEEGILYVANIEKGQWIPLVHNDPRLKSAFKDQTDLLTHCRIAAKLVGATPLDRPEDIEIDPFKGDVLIACTNNKPAKRPYGSILKIREKRNDPRSLTFTAETYMTGGEAGGLACPDNLAFDRRGNLWITTDISGWDMHKGAVQNFGNNGLFVVMRQGPMAGIPVQLASAPMDAEFTGPVFSPDGKTLFLSVQHPGETSTDLKNLTSTWPDGKHPRASVITIQGPLLEKITGVLK